MAKVTISEFGRRFFIIHLTAYLMVMAFLTAINFKHTPDTLWFIYPAFGWGIGVVVHFLFSIVWVKDKYEDTRDGWKKGVYMRSFLIHFILYAMVNSMLTYINLTYSPDTLWVFYPVFGWGIGLVMHFVFILLWKPKSE